MLLKGAYTWSQTPQHITLEIPLHRHPSSTNDSKNNRDKENKETKSIHKQSHSKIQNLEPLTSINTKTIDIFVSDLYLKVSYPPYIIHLDLWGYVVEERCRSIIDRDKGLLTIQLFKLEKEEWFTLIYEGPSDKERRLASIQRHERLLEKQRNQVKETKQLEEKSMLRNQMALEKRQREKLQDIKEKEKDREEQEVYKSFERLKKQKKEGQSKQKEEKITSKKKVSFTESDKEKPDIPSQALQAQHGIITRPIKSQPSAPPPIRKRIKATFHVTPRLFKTPIRESTFKKEQTFILKNRHSLKTNKLLNDISSIDENPVWLLRKANEFHEKHGDYLSAINACTQVIELLEGENNGNKIEALSQRAECYLQMNQLEFCIQDCQLALSLMKKKPCDVEDNKQDGLLVTSSLYRKLGHAFFQNEKYTDGNRNIQKAFQIIVSTTESDKNKHLQELSQESEHSQNILKACEKTRKANTLLIKSRYTKQALELYGQAIQHDKTYIHAYSNRSLCHLQLGEYMKCIQDCNTTLNFLSRDFIPKRKITSITSLNSKKKKRKDLVISTISRRASARMALEDYDGCLKDLEAVKKILLGQGDDYQKEDINSIQEDIDLVISKSGRIHG